MKKLVSLLLTGMFVLPLTIATLTHAQDAAQSKDQTAAAGKKTKKSKAKKEKKEKKPKKGAGADTSHSGM